MTIITKSKWQLFDFTR